MSRGVNWHFSAWEDYEYRQCQDRKTLKKINTLMSPLKKGAALVNRHFHLVIIRRNRNGKLGYCHLFSVDSLIKTARRTPEEGAEPLKGELSGFYSRHINKKDVLVYTYDEDSITVVQCRFHYSDEDLSKLPF